MGAPSIEEWLRQNEFADIEFRSVGVKRQACLKGALLVWQVILSVIFVNDRSISPAGFGSLARALLFCCEA